MRTHGSGVVIVGAGGFARETRGMFESLASNLLPGLLAGFVAPAAPNSRVSESLEAEWLGDDDAFLAAPSASKYLIAIADPVLRQSLALRYDAAGLKPATLIHPTASIGPNVTIGPGSIVCAMVSITTDVVIGAHVHIDRSVTIGHDSVIENFATLHPAGVISGDVKVGTRARIGSNATILQGLHVGADAVIGAGAVVTRNVDEFSTVVGVPARPFKPTGGDFE